MSARPPPSWSPPIALRLLPTLLSDSFRDMPEGWTGLPIAPHPGAFGVGRRRHVHEGVDLYCPEGTEVHAMEPGRVVAIEAFTGLHASPPSPWWRDTWAVLVEGASGVVLYGEIAPSEGIAVGTEVARGKNLGRVIEVLAQDKGRPTCMLHLELHAPGARASLEWVPGAPRPEGLRDPTPLLIGAAQRGWNPPGRPAFLKAGDELIALELVERLDISSVQEDEVSVTHSGGRVATARGFDAIEAVMMTRPSALEGRRLRWRRGAWAMHNILAHPAMQVLAWMGKGKLGVWLHDATTPTPTPRG